MIKILKKIWLEKWMFRSILSSIYFNFHYLPFSQAIKLPILLYKPKLLKCKGSVVINGKIKTGMICLGKYQVSLYPNTGIVFENHGGKIIFNGSCSIGNNSAISIGSKGCVSFGNNFSATTSLKLTSYCSIMFGEDVLCGWECLFMDTDFHQLTLINSNEKLRSYGSIAIGKGCWFSLKTTVMKGTVLPDYCVVAANSLLNKEYVIPEYSLIAGQPALLKRNGVFRDKLNDRIEY